MPNLAVITIAGHLGRDAELKAVGDDDVCKFSVAVTTKRRDSETVAWYNCQMWGKRGAALAPKLPKGQAVIVTGELEAREYTGKKGDTRMSLDVRVSSFSFAGGGAGEGRDEQPRQKPAPAPTPEDDDQIPF